MTITQIRRTGHRLGRVVAVSAALASCGVPTSSPAPPRDSGPSAEGASHSWSYAHPDPSSIAVLGKGTHFVSDLPYVSASNNWGPVEKNRSNGTHASGDGRALTIGGITFAHGLGVHADSEVTYNLRGVCSTFSATIGVDDEVDTATATRGTVVFQVFGDTQLLYQSPLVNGTSGPEKVAVNVSGRQRLRLVVTDGGDDHHFDHADWAEASVTCAGSPPPPTSYSYAAIADQPTPVSEAQGEVVGGRLYVFGGFDHNKSCCTPTNRAHVYDPEIDVWTTLPVVPDRGMTHANLTTDGRYIYFAGGYTANSSWDFQVFGTRAAWRFDTVTRNYSRLPDLPTELAAGQLEYLNGRLHYVGGTNLARTTDLGSHYVLDMNADVTTWTTAAPLPLGRHHMGSAVLGGKIYAVGGQTGQTGKAGISTLDNVDAYDPATDSWHTVAPLKLPRSHISDSTFVMDGRIVVAGGETAHDVGTRDVSAYDPATNTWTALTPLPSPRIGSVAAPLGTGFIVTGGNATANGWRATPGN